MAAVMLELRARSDVSDAADGTMLTMHLALLTQAVAASQTHSSVRRRPQQPEERRWAAAPGSAAVAPRLGAVPSPYWASDHALRGIYGPDRYALETPDFGALTPNHKFGS